MLTAACAQVPDFAHVTNQDDPVPNVPPHFLDFEHPAGELHITKVNNSTGSATMVACPGSENDVSSFCPAIVTAVVLLSASVEMRGRQLAPRHLDPEPLGAVLQRYLVR